MNLDFLFFLQCDSCDNIFFSDETYLKIYDGELTDPKLCKNVAIPRTAQVSNVLVSFFFYEL